jgi:hypothetical protein
MRRKREAAFFNALNITRMKGDSRGAPASGYRPPAIATSFKTGRFTGTDFPLQPDGTLRCPAGGTLTLQERRPEADGSLRLVYAASIRSCRSCGLREQCQRNGNTTKKPRQVSMLLRPLSVGREALLWQDWSRRGHRRACIQLLLHQRVEVSMPPPVAASPPHQTRSSLVLNGPIPVSVGKNVLFAISATIRRIR